MPGPKLMNCALCGRVVQENPVGLCPPCLAELDDEFQLLRQVIEKEGRLTAPELEARTGVPLAHIEWLVRTGRLYRGMGGGRCSICGEPAEGSLCRRCATKLQGGGRRARAHRYYHAHEAHEPSEGSGRPSGRRADIR